MGLFDDGPDIPPPAPTPPPAKLTENPSLESIAQARRTRLRNNRQSLIVDPGLSLGSAPTPQPQSGNGIRIPGA
jgi:hypothetical protein